jgi:hypothetical protein
MVSIHPQGDAEKFFIGLAHLLRNAVFSYLKSEIELERAVSLLIRAYTKRSLDLSEKELESVVFAHGETKEEKRRWTDSKPMQNVYVFGCSNTSDIFLLHPAFQSIYIELKFSKQRGGLDSLPGDLQRAIGQSIIASLRHPYVICFVLCDGVRKSKQTDLGKELTEILWKNHHIALIIQRIKPSSLKEQINKIRPDQLHKETDWGEDHGREAFDFWDNPDDAVYDKL